MWTDYAKLESKRVPLVHSVWWWSWKSIKVHGQEKIPDIMPREKTQNGRFWKEHSGLWNIKCASPFRRLSRTDVSAFRRRIYDGYMHVKLSEPHAFRCGVWAVCQPKRASFYDTYHVQRSVECNRYKAGGKWSVSPLHKPFTPSN